MAREIAIVLKEKSSTSQGGSSSPTSTASKSTGIGALFKPLAAIGIGLTLFSDLLKPIVSILKFLLAVVFLPLIGIMLDVVKPALETLVEAFKTGSETNKDKEAGTGLLKSGVQTLGADTGFMGVIADYTQGLKDIKEMTGIAGIAMRALGIILWPIVFIFDVLKTSVLGVIWFFTTLWEGAKTLGAELYNLGASISEGVSGIWTTVKESLSTAWIAVETVWTTIKTGLTDSWDLVKGVWDTIKESLSTAWTSVETVWTTIKDGLDTVWTSLKSAFNSIIDGLITLINKIPFINVGGGKAFGGTVATDGMYPLHAGETVLTRNSTNGSSGGNTFNINITGNYNQSEIVRKLTSEITRRVGL